MQIIIICLITAFSFYYTNHVIDLIKSKDPLMQNIKDYNSKSKLVNGILSNNTMLVGTSGKKVDIDKSYQKMKIAKTFNEELLEYINIKPEITKSDNIDKLLIGKNTKEKEISLVFEIEDLNVLKQIVYILQKNNIKATFFIDNNLIDSNIQKLNRLLKDNDIGLSGGSDNFNYIKTLISKNDFNYANYCLYKDNDFLIVCKLNKINTISPTLIGNNLYNKIKKTKTNGYIYQIKTTPNNIKELNSTIIYLKQKGYQIPTINELLKE